jgi:sec-independent protein translocase protein TatB
MLPEVGGLEYIIIAAVALIVVGPKDLPVMLRKLGQWVGRLRAMAAEFRASFDDMARQSELDELQRDRRQPQNLRHPVPSAPRGRRANPGAGSGAGSQWTCPDAETSAQGSRGTGLGRGF